MNDTFIRWCIVGGWSIFLFVLVPLLVRGIWDVINVFRLGL